MVRALEDHWSYSGSYKFLTNNCATESRVFLNSILESKQLAGQGIDTPKNVLKGLVKNGLVDLESSSNQIFPAQSEYILASYREAYGQATSVKSIVTNLNRTTSEGRGFVLNYLMEMTPELKPEKDSLLAYDAHLQKIGSFETIEKFILGNFMRDFQAKILEFDENSLDNSSEVKKTLKNSENKRNLTHASYGIPFFSDLKNVKMDNKLSDKDAQKAFGEIFPKETSEYTLIAKNIQTSIDFRNRSRKIFRRQLEIYLNSSIESLIQRVPQFMEQAANGSEKEIEELRRILDLNLITKKEFTNKRLASLITKLINENGLPQGE